MSPIETNQQSIEIEQADPVLVRIMCTGLRKLDEATRERIAVEILADLHRDCGRIVQMTDGMGMYVVVCAEKDRIILDTRHGRMDTTPAAAFAGVT